MKNNITPGLYGTIDIGTKSVKAILIEVTNKEKRLLNIEEVDIASFDTFMNEEEYNKQITEAIAKLAKSLDLFKCKKIISLFYNRDLQVKLLDFPNTVKQEQFSQILPWEAKKILSPHFKDQEFTYSYAVIRGNPLSIALAVVPLQLLNSHLSLFEGTGIKPDSVYTDVFSTLSLQSIVDIAGLPALSIVNFGFSGTHLNIFSAGKLKFYRYIPSGVSEMTNPPRESELEMYSQKIRFSFDYFRAVSKLNQVDALFFMGGGSSIPDVLGFEQNYFSPTKINALDISSEIDISPVIPTVNQDNIKVDNNLKLLPFVPAIGACLTNFRDNSETMDLLALIRLKKKEKDLEQLANTVPLILGLVSFVLASIFIYFQFREKIDELDNLKVAIKAIDKRLEEYKDNQKDNNNKFKDSNPIRLCENSLKLVKPVIFQKNALNYLFQVVSNVKPEKMQITDILVRNKQEAEQIQLIAKDEMESGNNELDSYEEPVPETIIDNFDGNSGEAFYEIEEPEKNQKSREIDNELFDIFGENEVKRDEETKPIENIEKKPVKIKKVKQNEQIKQKSNNANSDILPVSYTSKLSSPLTEQQIKEDFDGNVIVIHGFAENAIEVSAFSDALTTNPQDSNGNALPSAILRYIGITLRETDDGKRVEFLLKGVLK